MPRITPAGLQAFLHLRIIAAMEMDARLASLATRFARAKMASTAKSFMLPIAMTML
jgi:hypothetical protein